MPPPSPTGQYCELPRARWVFQVSLARRAAHVPNELDDGLGDEAAAGNAVLFYDPDDTGEITETRQFIFTEWDPTATSDLEALASVIDSNGDGT